MLTPSDIRDDGLRSGYRYVDFKHTGAVPKGHPGGPNARPYQASKRLRSGGGPGYRWMGPRRATALEAAQDYCDYVNGQDVSVNVPLKSAGHPTKGVGSTGTRRAPQPQDRKGYVYLCAEEGDDRYVKIGKSGDHPKYRLNNLQTGNPRKLKMLGWIETNDRAAAERALQQKYIHLNVLGEWFRKDPKILQEFPQTQRSIGTIRSTA